MHYALKAHDGRIAILQLMEGATIDAEVAKFSSTNWVPEIVVPIDPKDIPSDRRTRNAWSLVGKKIVVPES